jgi:hypothetical protein
MSVFTVYCHGTSYNRHSATAQDELVAWFHNNTAGSEANYTGGNVTNAGTCTYMINEGPGHGGEQGLLLPQQANPHTGDAKRANPQLRMNTWDTIAGNALGTGWDENVLRTVNIVAQVLAQRPTLDTVNLLGWSRGAITCIRIADALKRVYPNNQIRCNIFAVDPVAGARKGKTMEDTKVLNDNVTNYIAILAMHEMAGFFKVQDWKRVQSNAARAIMLPMPGVHSAAVIPQTPLMSAEVTRSLAWGFMDACGTNLNPLQGVGSVLTTPAHMCMAYARLVLDLSEHRDYENPQTERILGGLRRRSFAKHSRMDLYTRGGKESYWINEHHRACFEAAYPNGYNFIFEGRGAGQRAAAQVDQVFANALAYSQNLRDSLRSKGLLNGANQIEGGSGRYANHVRVEWPTTFPLTHS